MENAKPPYDHFVSEDCDSDVCEEIRVFPDYIKYNTWCWPCWIDYSKLEYKVEWFTLYVKAFEYAYVSFDNDFEETKPFYFIKDWKLDTDEFNRYIDRCIEDWKKEAKDAGEEYTEEDRQFDIECAIDVIDDAKKYSEWHEFQYIDWPDRYSTNARRWIMRKVKNKDWDRD